MNYNEHRMAEDNEYITRWEAKWSEREVLLKSLFGETSPPNIVHAFEWPDVAVSLPGACSNGVSSAKYI